MGFLDDLLRREVKALKDEARKVLHFDPDRKPAPRPEPRKPPECVDDEHDFGRWSPVYEAHMSRYRSTGEPIPGSQYIERRQQRECTVCGFVEERVVKAERDEG